MTLTLDSLKPLCDALTDAVIALDHEGRVCLLNHTAEAVLGIEAEILHGQHLAGYPATRPLLPLFDVSPARTVFIPPDTRYDAQVVPLPTIGQLVVLSIPERQGQFPALMREIVHELKAPITSSKGFIDLVETLGGLTDKQVTFIHRAQRSLESMLGLVHELLDMAWLEADGELDPKDVDLNDLVRYAITQHEGYARHQNIQFELDLPPDGCTIWADERRIAGAISNLISNAIKYSPEGGPVRVSVDCNDEQVTLTVADQGLGIAPEHIAHIFENFYRVRTQETKRIEGSGLGLSIAKAIIEKHGGSMLVHSTPGEGSVFGFSLASGNTV